MAHPVTALRDILGTSGIDDLIGSGRNERLFGYAGNDRLYGLGGNDILYGGSGADLLDGGTGADTMFGGSGNDIYRVDNPGDVVSETSVPNVDDGGIDYVLSAISFKLGAFIEKLELTGSGDLNGAGNNLDNTIKGNSGNNILFGGGGGDILYGNDGNDVLIGGLGKDYLYGGTGADTFVFAPEPGTWNRIYDFEAGDKIGIYADEFGLSQGSGLIGGLLDPDYFVFGSSATAAHGQFLFKTAGSLPELLWDSDGTGSGKAINITYLSPGALLSAADMVSYGDVSVVKASISAVNPGALPENSGDAYFALQLSQALNKDTTFIISTQNGSATAGQDFVGFSGHSVTLAAGTTVAYIAVALLDDSAGEGTETFSLKIDDVRITASGEKLALDQPSATASIVDEGAQVVADHFTTAWHAIDPAGIIFNPLTGGLLVSDSEVEEVTPYTDNLYSVTLDGTFISSFTLPFTTEATGLALDAKNGLLYISDDDQYKIFAVDIADPTRVLKEFDTLALGGVDPEDIAFDPNTGHLYIVNGTPANSIVEIDASGQNVFSSIQLPSEISDPEALAYDAKTGLFYVGGGFSDKIYVIDHSGGIVDTISILEGARAEETGHRVNVKDLAFAPASDGSGETHLYVADYGWSHVDDGRVIEIDLGDGSAGWLIA